MNVCLKLLVVFCLLFSRILAFSEITKEDLLNEDAWFSFEENNENHPVFNLLDCPQGQFLLQALFYQHKCLAEKENPINFKINIELKEAEEGSNTNFLYEDVDKNFLVKIELATCESNRQIQTLKRPILIQHNDLYRLYKLEVPAYIILAHELLHVLNHAELFSSNKEDLIDEYKKTFKEQQITFRRNAIQKFLCRKLGLKENNLILEDAYKTFWENPYDNDEKDLKDLGDSLDEMTTILCSDHEIEQGKQEKIGETLFLREYYTDEKYKDLISWSHYDVSERMIFDKNKVLLDSVYVKEVLGKFSLTPKIIKLEEKMELKLINTQQMSKIDSLKQNYIYGMFKKPNAEISLVIPSNSAGYEFVDEKFVLLENSDVYNAIIKFRESMSNVPVFSRKDIFNCAKDQ